MTRPTTRADNGNVEASLIDLGGLTGSRTSDAVGIGADLARTEMTFVKESNLRDEIARELAHSNGDLSSGCLINDLGWLVVGVALDHGDSYEVAFGAAAFGCCDFDPGAIDRQRLALTPPTGALGVAGATGVVLVVLEAVTQCLERGMPFVKAHDEVVVPANGLLRTADDVSHSVDEDHRHGVTAPKLTPRRIRDRD